MEDMRDWTDGQFEDAGFDVWQAEEIREGFENGLAAEQVATYAKPELSWERMEGVKEAYRWTDDPGFFSAPFLQIAPDRQFALDDEQAHALTNFFSRDYCNEERDEFALLAQVGPDGHSPFTAKQLCAVEDMLHWTDPSTLRVLVTIDPQLLQQEPPIPTERKMEHNRSIEQHSNEPRSLAERAAGAREAADAMAAGHGKQEPQRDVEQR